MKAVTEQSVNAPENATENAPGNASEEIDSLKARREQLLELVGELLRTNEDLRQKVARLEAQGAYAQAN